MAPPRLLLKKVNFVFKLYSKRKNAGGGIRALEPPECIQSDPFFQKDYESGAY